MEDFLKALGIPAGMIAKILAEDAKQEDLKALAETWKDDQRTIVKAEVEKNLKDAYKEEAGAAAKKAVENSLKGKIKRELGLDIPGVKDLTMDDFLAKAKEQVEAARQGGDSELKAELDKYKRQYSDAIEKVDALNETLATTKEELTKAVETERRNYAVRQKLDASLSSIPWAFEKEERIKREQEIIRREIEEKFKIDPETGKILNKDDTPVIKGQNEGVIKTVDEWINDYVDRYDMRRKNNARGGQAGGTGSGGSATGGKDGDVDRSTSSKYREELGLA